MFGADMLCMCPEGGRRPPGRLPLLGVLGCWVLRKCVDAGALGRSLDMRECSMSRSKFVNLSPRCTGLIL